MHHGFGIFKLVSWGASAALVLALGDEGPPVRRGGSAGAAANVVAEARTIESVQALVAEGSYAEADRLGRELLISLEAAAGSESMPVARLLDLVVEARWKSGLSNDPESEPFAQRAVRIKERHLGPEHPDVAVSLNNLAIVLEESGRYEAARPVYERALAVRRRAFGPDDPEVAATLNEFGTFLMNTADYDSARVLLECALEIRAAALGPDHLDVARTLNPLAIVAWKTDDFAAAKRCYARALAIREKALGPDHPEVAGAVNNLATLLLDTGEYVEAKALFERALAIRTAAYGERHRYVGSTLTNLANLYTRMEDSAQAREHYEQALDVFEATVGTQHPMYAACLFSYGSGLLESGDAAGAHKVLSRALSIQEMAVGAEHPDVAECLQSLAVLAADGGDPRQARQLLGRALAILENAYGPGYVRVGACLASLARVEGSQGNAADGVAAALRAEDIGRDHLQLVVRTLPERQALSYASVRTTGLDPALSLAVRSADAALRVQVLDALVRSRAVVLDELGARRHSVLASQDPEVARLDAALTRARTRYANLVVRGAGGMSPENYRQLVAGARRDKEAAEQTLAERSPLYGEEVERRGAGFDVVAAHLDPDDALVSYVLYEDDDFSVAGGRVAGALGQGGRRTAHASRQPKYAAFVVRDGGRRIGVHVLGTAREIDALVGRWKLAVTRSLHDPDLSERDAEQACRRTGKALGAAVWSPLQDDLQGARRVFVVPDGALNVVNLGALPANGDRYLVETDLWIHVLSAERDLALEHERRRNHGLLAVGGAAFGGADEPQDDGASSRVAADPCAQFTSLRFEPLPASQLEVEEIAAIWSRAQGTLVSRRKPDRSGDARAVVQLTGAQATEAAFKAQAPGKSIVHLATHGFFLDGPCAPGRPGTRGIERLTARARPTTARDAGENPLLQAGLALAHANRRLAAPDGDDDGILTAEEICGLDLRGVDWAVLSACDTGTGEVRAREGVLGLRRAFQMAGAGTLILSLWSVQDEATRQWMRALYTARFETGLETAEAVREASRRVLAARRLAGKSGHPYYWAGFVAAGDWR